MCVEIKANKKRILAKFFHLGTMFSTAVLSKYCNVHDGIIGSFSGIMNTLAATFFIFACNTWMIWTGKLFLNEMNIFSK